MVEAPDRGFYRGYMGSIFRATRLYAVGFDSSSCMDGAPGKGSLPRLVGTIREYSGSLRDYGGLSAF